MFEFYSSDLNLWKKLHIKKKALSCVSSKYMIELLQERYWKTEYYIFIKL